MSTTPRLSEPEENLAGQLRMLKLHHVREFRFAPPRKWRADFMVGLDLLVEVDGGAFVAGRHSRGRGFEADCEKQSAAAVLGYRVIRCTPRQVDSGQCVAWIEAALHPSEKAA